MSGGKCLGKKQAPCVPILTQYPFDSKRRIMFQIPSSGIFEGGIKMVFPLLKLNSLISGQTMKKKNSTQPRFQIITSIAKYLQYCKDCLLTSNRPYALEEHLTVILFVTSLKSNSNLTDSRNSTLSSSADVNN